MRKLLLLVLLLMGCEQRNEVHSSLPDAREQEYHAQTERLKRRNESLQGVVDTLRQDRKR